MKSTKKEIPNTGLVFISVFPLFIFKHRDIVDDNKKRNPCNWISELPGSIEFDVKGGTKDFPADIGSVCRCRTYRLHTFRRKQVMV